MIDMVDHVETLIKYASECDSATEFGVRIPDETSSTRALLMGVKHKLTSYDIVNCDVEPIKKLAEEMGKEFVFIQANSNEVQIQKTDLLMIDAEHSYYAVHKDLKKHSKFVKYYIVLHDTMLFGREGEHGQNLGIMDAIEDFLDEHNEWDIGYYTEVCCGLTILKRIPHVDLPDLR